MTKEFVKSKRWGFFLGRRCRRPAHALLNYGARRGDALLQSARERRGSLEEASSGVEGRELAATNTSAWEHDHAHGNVRVLRIQNSECLSSLR